MTGVKMMSVAMGASMLGASLAQGAILSNLQFTFDGGSAANSGTDGAAYNAALGTGASIVDVGTVTVGGTANQYNAGKVLSFTGGGDKLTIPYNAVFASDGMNANDGVTISFWANPGALVGGNSWKGVNVATTSAFYIAAQGYNDTPQDKIVFGGYKSTTGTAAISTFSNLMVASEWHLYTVVVSYPDTPANASVTMYRDGAQVGATATGVFGNVAAKAGTDPLKIRVDTRATDSFRIDDYRVYGGALNATQVAEIYSSAIPEPTAVSLLAVVGTAALSPRRRRGR